MLQVFGQIGNPLEQLGGTAIDVNTGLPLLISNIIRTIIAFAGVFALFNLITAGLAWITSGGDPKGVESARQKIYMSIVGLVIIAASFLFAAIISQLLFGDYSLIFQPTIYGPGTI